MSKKKSCTAIDKNFAKLIQLHETSIPMHDTKPGLFKKLLDEDFDIHYKVPDISNVFETNDWVGCTIFELIYTETAMCKVLIDRGADFTATNKEGSTVLLQSTFGSGYGYYLSSLKSRGANEEFYADLILSAHIKSGNPKNPKDKNGLSHFHVACMYNRADTVKFFLDNGVSINETLNGDSKFNAGFSALHFAVKSCAVETVEVLLASGADMFVKDSKGMNPLHLLMIERKKAFVQLRRLSRIGASSGIRTSSNRHLQNYYIKNQKIIYLLLERMNGFGRNVDEGIQLSTFHVLCFMGNTSRTQEILGNEINNKEILSQSVSTDSPVWPGYTPLHFAAHSSVETVELLVMKGADLCTEDANGVTPFDICLREFSLAVVHRILSLQPDYSNIVFSNGKTKLSDIIQAMQEIATFEIFLKTNLTNANMFIPFNSAVCAGCTPLHLAVICTERPMSWGSKIHGNSHLLFADFATNVSQTYLSRIDLCLRYNPDVTTRDAKGSTPLHWAFRLQQSRAVDLLLGRLETSSNYVDEHGLSHLHIACAARNESVVKRLLDGGANVNEIVRSNHNWSYVIKEDPKCPVNKCIIAKGSTPSHCASTVQGPAIVEILIDHGADVLAQDADGLNPLERIFGVPIFRDSKCPKPWLLGSFNARESETVELLVRKIGAGLADSKPKQVVYCYSLLKDDVLVEILRHIDKPMMKILGSVGITALHVACFTRNLLQVNYLADIEDVNSRVDLESPLWPGCTPLHLFTKRRWGDPLDPNPTNRAIVKKLLRRGADVAAMNAKGDTPIHQIFRYSWYYLGKLLKRLEDFSANPMSRKGYTHLHIASFCGAVTVVEQLLEHGAMIDQPTDYFAEDYGGFTALHFAAAYQRENVVDVLLRHGADVNWKNAQGGNPLHAANREDREPCFELLQTLIGAGVDIHATNMYGETPLEALIKSRNRTKEEIGILLENGCRVNTVNPMSDEGFLAVALNRNRPLSIFEIVVNAADVKDIDSNGRNAIHNAVSFKRPDWDDFEVWTINEKYTPSEEYVKGITSLMKLRLNIDHQDCKGSTPLHVAAQMQNLTGIVGLLENGADINIVDAVGKPAFVYSLELAMLHEEFMELDLRILKVISIHLCKLSMASIGISVLNREVDAKIREILLLDIPTTERCRNEVERMREEEIDSTNVTLYDFLSDTGAVSAFPHLLLSKRIAIDYFFKNEIKNLRDVFPELTGVLLLQYRKALARVNIIESAVTSLNILEGFDVPAVCSRVILRFLSNDELSNLISSTT